MFNSCAISVRLEVGPLPNSLLRPAIFAPECVISKKQHIFEASYVNEFVKSITKNTNFNVVGNAARHMAIKKTDMYASYINPDKQIFQPIICKTSRSMNKEGVLELIEFVATKFSPVAFLKDEDDTPKFTTYWLSRLSTWLQICNGNAVIRATTEAIQQRRVRDFSFTLRDVQEISTDEDTKDGFSDKKDDAAILEALVQATTSFSTRLYSICIC